MHDRHRYSSRRVAKGTKLRKAIRYIKGKNPPTNQRTVYRRYFRRVIRKYPVQEEETGQRDFLHLYFSGRLSSLLCSDYVFV